MDFNIFNYIFPEMTIGIVLITMIVRTQVSRLVQAKWVTLVVALFGAAIQFILHVVETPEVDFEFWKAVNSMGIAVIAYDYVVKVIKDWIAGRNPVKNV